jgi:hypothetical protein
MRNLIKSSLVALALGGGLAAAEAEAQYPLEFRGPGIQVGGLDIFQVWSLKQRVVPTPLYQRYDTFAATPCGPKYVGSSYQQVGTVGTVVQRWEPKPVITWSSDKSIFGALGRLCNERERNIAPVMVQPMPATCGPKYTYPKTCSPEQPVRDRQEYDFRGHVHGTITPR